MRRTFFDTPVLKRVLHLLALFYMWAFRWKKEGRVPDAPKFVMIAAPHTSNWDLPMTLILALAFGMKIFWLGKHTIFRPPFGGLFRWLGGIPVDRRQANNLVAQCVQLFQRSDRLVMIIPPEGTRSKVRYWKTGFYYIAHGAGVPISLGYVDYKRRAGGMGPTVTPTGDIEADMRQIRSFYAGVTGKNPHQWAEQAIGVTRKGDRAT
ncbi:MAG: lysophospholipid acyltransferase family protein [Pseudomonadota bacterium]|nr:lysophospholipid acyltransferase family protein [Pseudomonadota bacterium]